MFGSLKEFHIAVCNFTTHILLISSKSKWRIRSPFQGGDHNTALFNSVLQGRRVIFIKKNGVPTIVILKVIVNVEGLWVRNPFRIQSEWKILWSRPWRLHRTHLKLLRKENSLQEAPGLHTRLSCVLSGGAQIALMGQESWPLTPKWLRVMWLVGSGPENRDVQRGQYLDLLRQQNYLYLYWNKSGDRCNSPFFCCIKSS